MRLAILIYCLLALLLFSCHKSSTSNEEIIKIEERENDSALFFTGNILPLSTTVISSPYDGVIVDIAKKYGESVKKGDVLFKLASSKYVSEYKALLMQFLKTKGDYHHAQMQLNESLFLHKNGLISDDDFKMKQSQFYASRLQFIEARDALDILLKQTHNKNNYKDLSIANIEVIRKALNENQNLEKITLVSPATGMFLAGSKNDNEIIKFKNGDTVKQGEVLALIGNMQGLSVKIPVNELTINQLKVGQAVDVTGMAFENYALRGTISSIDKQAEKSGANLPTFNVEITIPSVPREAKKYIYPGMSAKVTIKLNELKQIWIPLNSVIEKGGDFFVTLKKGKFNQLVPIKTGKTSTNQVAILAGLKQGDEIVIAH